MEIAIWVSAVILYVIFRLWYDGLKKPLTAEEIERFAAIIERRADAGVNTQDVAMVRKFMEEDDGKEFLMANLASMNASPVKHPDTGEPVQARALLTEYFRPLMKSILRRAGHPVLTGRAVGGYLDAWNTPPDPGWHVAGFIRYRSRRDAMLAFLAEPSFDAIHKYKIAALKQTFAFPTQLHMGFYASPRITAALVLALGASILHLIAG